MLPPDGWWLQIDRSTHPSGYGVYQALDDEATKRQYPGPMCNLILRLKFCAIAAIVLLTRLSYLLAIRSELRFPHSQYRPGFLFCPDDVQTGSRPISQHFEHPQHSKNEWL